MPGKVRAVIDVGTNSVKLLIGEVSAAGVLPLHESSSQTRLGQGFYETHLLQEGPIRETAQAIAGFATTAAAFGSRSTQVIATSAARDARNKDDLLKAIRETAGLEVTIISGEQEADWAYRGVTSDARLAGKPLLVMDVGGGSTEFILGRGGNRLFSESFPLGSLRLLEKLPLPDLPGALEQAWYQQEIDAILHTRVRPHLEAALKKAGAAVQLVGTGGTSTILARIELKQETFDRDPIEGTVLSCADVQREKALLWSLPLQERRNMIGLPANRADVILPGVLIFERVMTAFQLDSLRVSTRGIRFAALMAN
jgi:exopolyphosphatase / guanosine-5'-triphosphate,3'-diphosphate pyrophosphatase